MSPNPLSGLGAFGPLSAAPRPLSAPTRKKASYSPDREGWNTGETPGSSAHGEGAGEGSSEQRGSTGETPGSSARYEGAAHRGGGSSAQREREQRALPPPPPIKFVTI